MLHKSKLMLPILAAIVGVSASAFTDASTGNNLAGPTWTYMGPATQTQAELDSASNYQLGSSTCDGFGKVCTIEAPSDGGSPQRPVLNQGHVSINNSAYSPEQKQ